MPAKAGIFFYFPQNSLITADFLKWFKYFILIFYFTLFQSICWFLFSADKRRFFSVAFFCANPRPERQLTGEANLRDTFYFFCGTFSHPRANFKNTSFISSTSNCCFNFFGVSKASILPLTMMETRSQYSASSI